jgi:glutathione S-transferase
MRILSAGAMSHGDGMSTMRLHHHPLSGHSHRVELFLTLLGLPFELVRVDVLGGEQKRASFLALNSLGQVPVLEDGAQAIPDSNAILVYLALRHDPDGRWYPRDAAGAAAVQRWLSIAAGQLAAGPGAARLVKLLGAPHDLGKCQAIAAALFGYMEQHLGARAWLAAGNATIADLAMYAYTARAPEGGIDLEPYPNVRAWLARVEALPGFVPMAKVSA